tara:strand:+ start:228 stop:518 length:291 start_codon:yes stop_codon:yes gene_type:complete
VQEKDGDKDEDQRVYQMTSLGYSRRTQRHNFSDAALIKSLGLQQLALEDDREPSTLSGQLMAAVKGTKGASSVVGKVASLWPGWLAAEATRVALHT